MPWDRPPRLDGAAPARDHQPGAEAERLMASGRAHDRATTLLALPFGLLWAPALGPPGVAAAGAAFLVGGLWLSPDLDTPSRVTTRWGPLALLWWPYRRCLRHRSLLSHSPLLGTAGRLAWLAGLIAAACLLLLPLGAPSPHRLAGGLVTLWEEHRPLVIAALVGLEASAWLHLVQDGDPVPRPPRLLRSLGRRRRPRKSQTTGIRPQRLPGQRA